LADDALESAASDGVVKRNGDGYGCPVGLQLHDAVATTLAHGDESVLL